MKNLKTLKDLEYTFECQDVSPDKCVGREQLFKELREEAKKWRYFILHETCGEESSDTILTQISWITHFFNLEEEDK